MFGRFEDMLVASSSHPAMLLYLDQAQSVGPDSMAAPASRAAARVGLNENLAREIMELHTVGVDAGYTQADVTEFARAMTGWSIGGLNEPDDVRGKLHVPRPRSRARERAPSWAGATPRTGEEQALAVLKDLAANPAHRPPHQPQARPSTSSPTIRRRRWSSGCSRYLGSGRRPGSTWSHAPW